MISNAAFIAARFKLRVAHSGSTITLTWNEIVSSVVPATESGQVLVSEEGGEVITESGEVIASESFGVVPSPPTIDPTTGDQLGTATSKTKTIKALVHFVQPSGTNLRMFNEFETGDAILDIDPDEEVDKPNLTFTFGDADWKQKEIGERLAKSWDVLFGDQRLSRTILLTRKR